MATTKVQKGQGFALSQRTDGMNNIASIVVRLTTMTLFSTGLGRLPRLGNLSCALFSLAACEWRQITLRPMLCMPPEEALPLT